MNILENWLQMRFAQALGATLFHFLWEGALIALLLAAVLLQGRSFSAHARYAVGCIALFALPLAFGLTLLMLWPASPTDLITVSLVRSQPPQIVAVLSGQELAETAKPLLQRLTEASAWAVPFWAAGVLLFSLYNFVSWMAAQRMRKIGVCLAPVPWQQRLNSLARQLRLSQPVKLLESCQVDVPVVIGFIRPAILVPVGLLTGCPPEQLELVLLHELAHVRRHDYVVNVFQKVVESLLFYHPAVWWVSSVVRAERENCCDDDVVAATGNAHGYAAALTRLEQIRGASREPALAASGGNLTRRIRRLLRQPAPPHAARAVPIFAAGLLAVSLGAALGPLQSGSSVSRSEATAAPAAPQLASETAAPTPRAAPTPQGESGAAAQGAPSAGPFDAGVFDPEAFDTRPLPGTSTRAKIDDASSTKAVSGKAIDEVIGKAIGTAAGEVAGKVIEGVGDKVGAIVADKVATVVDAKLSKVNDEMDKKRADRAAAKVAGKKRGPAGGKVSDPSSAANGLGDGGTLMAQAQKAPAIRGAPSPASSPYAKWLNEDVAYIITNAEREVFERLRSDEQRQQFIDRFWLRRDPTPGTSENEFQHEHYRRIAFANARFSAQIPGWKTDRGRIYVTFGPPDEIESHPSGGRLTDGSISTTSPFELWRYRYIEAAGAEGIFAFVDSNRNGEYPLMRSPIAQTRPGAASAIGAMRQAGVYGMQGPQGLPSGFHRRAS